MQSNCFDRAADHVSETILVDSSLWLSKYLREMYQTLQVSGFSSGSVDMSGISEALHTNSLNTAIYFSVKQYTSKTAVPNTICGMKHYVD